MNMNGYRNLDIGGIYPKYRIRLSSLRRVEIVTCVMGQDFPPEFRRYL
jgi:hypothetical protein